MILYQNAALAANTTMPSSSLAGTAFRIPIGSNTVNLRWLLVSPSGATGLVTVRFEASWEPQSVSDANATWWDAMADQSVTPVSGGTARPYTSWTGFGPNGATRIRVYGVANADAAKTANFTVYADLAPGV